MSIEFTLNGNGAGFDGDPDAALLYVLRDDLGMNGVRFGCGAGECGACTVLIDGEPANSCDTPVWTTEGKDVETVENYRTNQVVGALIGAFIAEQAAQCAFCSSGIIMTAAGLLMANPNPTRSEIDEALADRLCRCGTHNRVIRAIERVIRGDIPPSGTGEGLTTTDAPIPVAAMGNEFVRVLPDGTVSLSPGKVEYGQGISTSLAQIAADALGVRIERIRLHATDTSTSPNQGVTSGSLSIAVGGAEIREAAVSLREELLSHCASSLGVAVDQLSVDDGTVTSAEGGRTTYWEVLGGSDTIPGEGPCQAALGTPVPRWDLPDKLTGGSGFLQDMRLPDMLHGRVVRAPEGRLELSEADIERASAMPGVVEVISNGRFLAVVAEREHQAVRAAAALENDANWIQSPPTADSSHPRELPSEARDMTEGQSASATADAAPSPEPDAKIVTAAYSRPFIAHASIGPSCAIAVFEPGSLTVWSHSQGVFNLRRDLAMAMRLPEDQVRVIHAAGSGCYGHNGADDAALDAALIAERVPGRPVRLQWFRGDEFLREPYGPAMTIELSTGLDRDGRIVSWTTDVWSQTHSARPGRAETPALLAASEIAEPFEVPPSEMTTNPAGGATRNSRPLYEVGDYELTAHFVSESPVRTSALRSLGAHANVFAIESHMDELAAEADVDPVTFRIRHLSDARAVDVIETVTEMAGVPVGGQTSDGHGYGLGFARYKNSSCYAAAIAEVVAEDDVLVPRIWIAVDAGLIVNPDGAVNQIEGGCIQSASWALREELPLDGGHSAAATWSDYPILRFGEVPEVTVELIDRLDEPSLGVGEGAQGPTTAAIANGLRAVLGVPIRNLPYTRESVARTLLQ